MWVVVVEEVRRRLLEAGATNPDLCTHHSFVILFGWRVPLDRLTALTTAYTHAARHNSAGVVELELGRGDNAATDERRRVFLPVVARIARP